MKLYELKRLLTFSLMPALLVRVRRDLKRLLRASSGRRLSVLDVGGRKSPYTIALPIDVTILDIPRESDQQKNLNLGLTDQILASIKENRSNVVNLILEDMTTTSLESGSFDAVICVEVIEHVPEDEQFVKNIAKVVRSGGWAYFTTPNGDYIKNEFPNFNPDHQRHYKLVELKALLDLYFDKVEVFYAIKTGRFRVWGLPGYSVRRPFTTLKAMTGNLINRWESRKLNAGMIGSAHLVAIAHKN